MRRFCWATALVVVCLAGARLEAQGTGQVPFQGPYVRPQVSPYPRPTVSPYLNLFRGGSTALNYYNLVRPQQEFQSTLNLLDTRADLLGLSLAEERTGPLITGHRSQFMTHGRYFFNLGARQAIMRPAVVPQAIIGAGRPGN